MRVVIAHAAWAPERVASLARLRSRLYGDAEVSRSSRPEHSQVWERRVWESIERGGEPVVKLEDAVDVCPGFLEACEVVAELARGESVSLHLQAPEAATVPGHWTRCYWLSGSACIVTPELARSVLDYASSLPWHVVSQWPWDNLTMHWAYRNRHPFLACLPSLARRDTSVPSTTPGCDDHPHRVPPICAAESDRIPDPAWWGPPDRAPLVQNPWRSLEDLERNAAEIARGEIAR